MNKQEFFICEHCGNLVYTLHNSGVPLVCCGEPMKPLVANTVEGASREKHIPVVTRVGSNLVKVSVGALPHPMEEEHHIEWVYLLTREGGGQGKHCRIGSPCEQFFSLLNDEPIEVLAYCNLHGLWSKKIT